jgi:hypothetical protein
MPNKQANLIADFEQIEQTVIHIAIVIKAYYDKLIQEGFDPEFARELTRDFASDWWSTLFSAIGK